MKKSILFLALCMPVLLQAQWNGNCGSVPSVYDIYSCSGGGRIACGELTYNDAYVDVNIYLTAGGVLEVEMFAFGQTEIEVEYSLYNQSSLLDIEVETGTGYYLSSDKKYLGIYRENGGGIFWSRAQLPQPVYFDYETIGITVRAGVLGSSDEVSWEMPVDQTLGTQAFYVPPFSMTGSTTNENDCWNVKDSDGRDKHVLIYIPEYFGYAKYTTCSSITNYDTKLEIFNIDGSRTGIYNDDYSCSYGSLKSTNIANLASGFYYVVVDGFGGKTGNFGLSVSQTTLKSANLNNLSDADSYEKEKKLQLEQVKIYPNPVSDLMYVELSENNGVRISVMDISGKVVRTINTEELNIEINCSGLVPGLYNIQILNGNDITNQKIQVQ